MAKIIGIVSGKGGVGKTTLVANLALSLKELGERVAAVDCNITTPHLSFYLGAYDYSLALNDVLKGNVVITSASYYHNGILIVPASQNIEDLVGVDIVKLGERLPPLKGLADIILLDSAPSLGREALSVLKASDEIIFVTTPLLPTVKDISKCKEVIKKWDLKMVGIVLNMVRNGKYELKDREIEKITSLPVIAKIPFDKNVLDALNRRIPIVQYKPNSPASIACMKLAANLLGIEPMSRKNIFSGFYDAFKRLVSFRETPNMGIKSFDFEVRTNADRILDLVKAEKSIKLSDLARRLNISKEETKNLTKILEEHNLIEFYSPLFGEVRVRQKNE